MRNRYKSVILAGSLALNLLITLPALLVITCSNTVRFVLYQNVLAPRFGQPDVAFLGDSLTLSGGLWGCRIGRYDFGVWNYGRDGFMTRQVLVVAQSAAAARPRVAFVMAGTNDPDQATGKEAAVQSAHFYFQLLDTLRKANIQPVIQLTVYRENEPHVTFIDELNAMLTGYAHEHQLRIIDLNRMLAPNKSLLPVYSLDGVHLTEAAYDVWSDQVRRVLDEIETERRRSR